MQCLRAHLCFSGTEHGDENLGEAMGDHGRAVCGALLGEVDGDVAELKLLATI